MRNKFFTMRINDTEKKNIKLIADYFQRSNSDAIRFIIRQSIKQFSERGGIDTEIKDEQETMKVIDK